jgi:hypothetical protein
MVGSKSIPFLLLFVFSQILWAQEVTVVLQNGLEGYDGCEDICISNATGWFNYAHQPDNEQLAMAYCAS